MAPQRHRPDPGGVFATDTHRRVLGHLPLPDETPTSTPRLLTRLTPDSSTPISLDGPGPDGSGPELDEVMADLEAEGFATRKGDKLKMTKAGFEALTGPVADEPPAVEDPDA